MRTLFWLTSIALVAAAVATVGVADYINNRPNSVLGRQASKVVAWWTRPKAPQPVPVAAGVETADVDQSPVAFETAEEFDVPEALTEATPPWEVAEEIPVPPSPVSQASYETDEELPEAQSPLSGHLEELTSDDPLPVFSDLPEEEDWDSSFGGGRTPTYDEVAASEEVTVYEDEGSEDSEDCPACEQCRACKELVANLFHCTWMKCMAAQKSGRNSAGESPGCYEFPGCYDVEVEVAVSHAPAPKSDKCCRDKTSCEPKCEECPAQCVFGGEPKKVEWKKAAKCCDSAINAKLEETVWIDFNERPLCEVVDEIRTLTGMNVYVDKPYLDCAGICLETPITVHLKNVPMKTALKCILNYAGLTYKIQDGIVVVTTPEGLHTPDATFVAAYYVADLVVHPAKSAGECEQSLIRLVMATIEPDKWHPYCGHVAYYPLGNCLVVRHTKEVHEQVNALLDKLREVRDRDEIADRASVCPECDMVDCIFGLGECGYVFQAAAKVEKCCGMVTRTYTMADMVEGFKPAGAAKWSERFVKLVTDAIEPASWDCAGGCGHVEYSAAKKCLVVRHTPETHERVRMFLDNLRGLEMGIDEEDCEECEKLSVMPVANPAGMHAIHVLCIELEDEEVGVQVKRDESGNPCICFDGVCIRCAGGPTAVMIRQTGAEHPPKKLEAGPEEDDAECSELEHIIQILEDVLVYPAVTDDDSDYLEDTLIGLDWEGNLTEDLDIPITQATFERAMPVPNTDGPCRSSRCRDHEPHCPYFCPGSNAHHYPKPVRDEDAEDSWPHYELKGTYEPQTPEDLPECEEVVPERLSLREGPPADHRLDIGCYYYGDLKDLLNKYADRQRAGNDDHTVLKQEFIQAEGAGVPPEEPVVPANDAVPAEGDEQDAPGTVFLYPCREYPDAHTTEFRPSDGN